MKRNSHESIDDLLKAWPFDARNLCVRMVKGSDKRDLIQMRVDMGILQLETIDRPDGERPGGYGSQLELLKAEELEDPDFVLDFDQCNEVDREFMQFYHRRICWLQLQYYHRAVLDADHTLSLMDLSARHSSDENWVMAHEQYRPFVLFHRTQALGLAELDEAGPEAAVMAINGGLKQIETIVETMGEAEMYDSEELTQRLCELRETLRQEYELGQTLQERLQKAVDSEQYELAARLRDELARQGTDERPLK